LRADVGIGPYNQIYLIDKLEFEAQCNVTERGASRSESK